MRLRRSVAAVSAGLILVGSLSACGSRSDSSASGTDSSKKVVKIGVVAPLTGKLSAMGLGIKNSVDLAVNQANKSNTVPGWTIQLVAEDDQASPDTGQNAATQLLADPSVVAAVGPLNSSVAQTVQPVFQNAGAALVSPANTNPTLTTGADFKNPKRPYSTYFRTCTTDIVQGGVAADMLYSELKYDKIATVNDKKTYGAGLVKYMTEAYTKLGGKVALATTINPDDTDFSSVSTQIKNADVQALYYGGEFPEASKLSPQMKKAGAKIPLMGGDGIFDDTYITSGGSAVNGDYATSVGAPAESLDSAKQFIADYKEAGYKDGYSAYGAYSYDAANAIIQALKVSLADKSDLSTARADTVKALADVSFDGTTGHVAFDEFGDTKSRVITLYQVKNGKWVALKTVDYKG